MNVQELREVDEHPEENNTVYRKDGKLLYKDKDGKIVCLMDLEKDQK